MNVNAETYLKQMHRCCSEDETDGEMMMFMQNIEQILACLKLTGVTDRLASLPLRTYCCGWYYFLMSLSATLSDMQVSRVNWYTDRLQVSDSWSREEWGRAVGCCSNWNSLTFCTLFEHLTGLTGMRSMQESAFRKQHILTACYLTPPCVSCKPADLHFGSVWCENLMSRMCDSMNHTHTQPSHTHTYTHTPADGSSLWVSSLSCWQTSDWVRCWLLQASLALVEKWCVLILVCFGLFLSAMLRVWTRRVTHTLRLDQH